MPDSTSWNDWSANHSLYEEEGEAFGGAFTRDATLVDTDSKRGHYNHLPVHGTDDIITREEVFQSVRFNHGPWRW